MTRLLLLAQSTTAAYEGRCLEHGGITSLTCTIDKVEGMPRDIDMMLRAWRILSRILNHGKQSGIRDTVKKLSRLLWSIEAECVAHSVISDSELNRATTHFDGIVIIVR